MTRIIALLSLFILTSAIDCNHNPAPTPGVLTLDAGGPCAAVCNRGRALGCHWAAPTPQGYPCEAVCENANDPAGPIHWDMACRVSAADCDAEARCQ